MNYGLPYMGSKSKIVKEIIRYFPRAENFYDLFGGGFSITHGMIVHRSNHYKNFHFNEIRKGVCDLIKDAINGKYSYENFKPEWISRDEFFKRIDDPYIKIVWSFGNNGRTYLFGKDIEKYKKSMHMALVFNQFDDYAKRILGVEKFSEGLDITSKRLYLKNRIKTLEIERLDMEQLQQLERLQQLDKNKLTDRINFYSDSYKNISIKNDSVIYCDIPYEGTAEYDKNASFNREDFLEWANDQESPVFISEYNISDERFKNIWNIEKRSLLNKDKTTKLIKKEKLYVNKAGYKKLVKG